MKMKSQKETLEIRKTQKQMKKVFSRLLSRPDKTERGKKPKLEIRSVETIQIRRIKTEGQAERGTQDRAAKI